MAITQFNNKHIRASSINIATDTFNNILIANLNSGTAASSTTYFRGDSTWATVLSNSIGNSPPRAVKQGGAVQEPNSTNVTVIFNATTPTITGTASVLRVSDGEYIKYTTTAVTNAIAGWHSAGTLFVTKLLWQPIFTYVIRTDAVITNMRLSCGLFNVAPDTTDTPSNSVGLVYSTATDGTVFWRTYTSGPSTQTRTATTTAVAANTRYVLQIDCTNPASIKFYINGTLVNTHTTNLPTTGTLLNFYARLTTLSASANAFAISKLHYEHQNV